MDRDSAAGPDGFTGKFFTSSWDIIGEDVYRAVQSFFCGEELPRRVTATSLVLLAKVARPKDFSEFRPISLCNFVNKNISKLLANRLASVLPNIISENQSGFVRGRLISDNYLLAQDLVSSIGRAARRGNVALKLDMMKTYDRVVWPFLINVLRTFGFGERWVDMVWRLISNVWFSVVVNGSSYGFFKSTRGFRQEDPLSPALFIIGAEVLLRSLNNLQSHRGFQGFRVPRGCPQVSHLGYADNVLIFSSASMKSLKLVKQVLTDYEAVSGKGSMRERAVSLCTRRFLCPRDWEFRGLLSQGGRIVLLKHVLSAMPTYLLMAASPPKAIFKQLEGGVGFRLLEDIHRASSIKLWWNFHSKSSLWASFMHAKFCRVAHPNLVFSEKGSEGWRRMVKVRALAERHIRWIIRSGSSNFWFDNWLGTGRLADRLDSVSDHKVAEFVQGGSWDVRRISQWVPLDIVVEIGRMHPPVGLLPDLMVWRPESSGHFTLKTAFSLVQYHSTPSPLFNRIWHPVVPLRVSFFLLRLLRDRLPLDCSVWKLGIQGPS
ncbi:uncharacterized protein [Coffea arabica]|uniref:Reverse transcriptase domain-containing protein n=1 Tax=Coffea arabica TaxID=13443 RepID=A0ABM4X6Z9_COFAR